MLFDLRGRGRRRTVQAIYLSLAILMGGGLILFGIGGATSGGLLDAFKSGGGQSTSSVFQKRIDRAEAAVKLNPSNAQAWGDLARLRYQSADYDQNTGLFTDSGKAQLRAADRAWTRYTALTKSPSPNVASLMVQAYSKAGLDESDKAVGAMEVVVDSRQPTAQLYVQLAALAYEAGQTRKAELASSKALSLASKDEKEQIKAQLEAARAQVAAAVGPDSVSGSTVTATTPSTTSTTP